MLVAVAIGVLEVGVPASADAARDEYRLRDLTTRPIVLKGDGDRAAGVGFRFPDDASQGPRKWWVLDLRFRVRFSPDNGPGFAWVSSGTNGRSAALVEYEARNKDGQLATSRTMGNVDGESREANIGAFDDVVFHNYLQVGGVRGGPSKWNFRLETARGTKVDRVRINGSSRIRSTRSAPYPLTLTARLLDEAPKVDEPFRVKVDAWGRRGTRVRPDELKARGVHSPLRIIGAHWRNKGRVFRIVSSRSGSANLSFTAQAGKARAATTLDVPVKVRGASDPPSGRLIAGVSVLIALTAWAARRGIASQA